MLIEDGMSVSLKLTRGFRCYVRFLDNNGAGELSDSGWLS